MIRDTMFIKINLTSEDVKVPKFETPSSLACDLVAQSIDGRDIDLPIPIGPRQTIIVRFGFDIEIPHGYQGQVRVNKEMEEAGLVLKDSPGIITSDDRSEVKAVLYNVSSKTRVINPGMKVAQLNISPLGDPKLKLIGWSFYLDR